jgi:hypothetical protein
LGGQVEWGDNWISFFREDDPSNVGNWPGQHQWMKDAMEKLLRAVGKRIRGGAAGEPRTIQQSLYSNPIFLRFR